MRCGLQNNGQVLNSTDAVGSSGSAYTGVPAALLSKFRVPNPTNAVGGSFRLSLKRRRTRPAPTPHSLQIPPGFGGSGEWELTKSDAAATVVCR
jgi:hypothetical protein